MKLKGSLGVPAVLFSVLFWGISFVATKLAMTDIPPISIAFLRQFIALVPLLIMMLFKKESFRLQKKEWLLFVIATLFGIVLYFVFENSGLTMTTASNASMLVAAIPVFALIAECVANKVRMDLASLFCMIASIFGVYFVIFEKGVPDFSSKSFWGNLLVLGAMGSWIVYTFLSKKLGERYSSLKMTTLQTMISIPLFTPFIIPEVHNWIIPSGTSMISLVFLGIFCSALAYVFYLYGLQTMGPVLPSAFLNLIPVVTILTDTVLLSVKLSLYQIIGAVLIVGSLSLLSMRKLAIKTVGKGSEVITVP
ncbi:MAG: DMT family transporter [Clostridia bacterium]|nr:DMT family transporter [Clostridia bacterium]